MQESLMKIHEASLKMLNEIGFRVPDEELLEILKDKGIKVQGDRAYFTEKDIMENIKNAPSEFKIYARNPKYDMTVNTESINYVPGYGCSQIREYDGNVRQAMLKDNLNFLEIVHSSEHFKINGGILAHPNDVKASLSYPIMIYAALKKSDKCVMGLTAGEENFKQILDLLEIAFGGEDKLKEKPRMISLINTLAPLAIADESIDTLKLSCEYNQAMVITPGAIGGATGPITLAGTIAMMNAEGLATIAIAQILKPGIPVVYGFSPSIMDLKTAGMAIGSPEYSLGAKYGSKLAKMYNLPCRAAGTQSDANGVTIQAGYEAMCNMYTAHQEKMNFVIHSAGILDGFSCISYEKFIADLEIINMMKYYFGDIEVNDKTIAFDVIKETVEKNTTFMAHKHTGKYCRKLAWKPTIAQRNKLALENTPFEITKEKIDNELSRLLNNYEKPELDNEIESKLDEYMRSIGVAEDVILAIK